MCICYKDMTFCTNDKCKLECHRKLTEDIIKQANEFGLPLSLAMFDLEKCKIERGSHE